MPLKIQCSVMFNYFLLSWCLKCKPNELQMGELAGVVLWPLPSCAGLPIWDYYSVFVQWLSHYHSAKSHCILFVWSMSLRRILGIFQS